MVEPNQTKFDELRKDNLIMLAKHLKLEVRSSMRKRDIQRTVLEHLVNESIFEQAALAKYQITPTNSAEVETTTNDNSEELDKVEKDRQWQREQEDRRWQREQEERKWEREKIELEREREREREERQIKLQQIELQKLELQVQTKDRQQSESPSSSKFDITKHIRMVPPFQEREVDKYFLHFEKVAKNCGWPKDHWTMLLQSVLLGKA